MEEGKGPHGLAVNGMRAQGSSETPHTRLSCLGSRPETISKE